MPSTQTQRVAQNAIAITVAGLVAAATVVTRAAAQTQDVAAAYLAVVTADDVDVRAGAHFRYYAFGRVDQGDVVRVVGEKAEWARVETAGPAFREFFGYVRFPAAENGNVDLTDGGRSLVTTGLVDLFAPNYDADHDPSSSWKPILTLQSGRRIEVIETRQARDERVHKVALPPDAQGWIKLENLRRATPSEQAAWEAGVSRKVGAAPASAPASPPSAAPIVQNPTPSPLPGPAPIGDLGASPGVRPLTQDEVSQTTGAAVAIIEDYPPAPIASAPPVVERPRPAPVPPAPAAPAAAIARLKDLEAIYARLLEEPPDAAEVEPLRNQFLELAKKYKSSRAISSHAKHRARQLELWGAAQVRQVDLRKLAAEAASTSSSVEKARWALETYGEYVAIGRLDASTVYDGRRLPQLFRLRHATSGQTIGYLQPDSTHSLSGVLGEVIGIVGESSYDGSLQVTLIKPTRIDRLDEKGQPLAPPAAAVPAAAAPALEPASDAGEPAPADDVGDIDPLGEAPPK